MGYRDLPSGPVTSQGSAGPGFYQTRGRGNKTGRVSPNDQVRGSARDLTLAKHGLIDQGAADPNQGQLFDTGPRPSNAAVIKERGLNMPTGMVWDKGNGKTQPLQFGAAPGYMPNLNAKQKVGALKSVQEARIQEGTYRGGATTGEIIQDRQALRGQVGNQAWYQGVLPSGEHGGQGDASKAINSRADKVGVGNDAMTRAAALTSPQSAWDMGKPGSPDYKMPNLTHAAGVVEATEMAKPYVNRAEAMKIGSEIPTSDGGLGTMGAKAAGVHYDKGNDVKDPLAVKSHLSQKAPNFEASLRLSDPSNVVRGMAAESYTVDRHDAKAAGIGSTKAVENRTGVYDVLAMTGSRTAFKNRELPPNEQAREWVAQRGPNIDNKPDNAMFEWSNRKKSFQPRAEAIQPGRAPSNSPKSRISRRGSRDIAKDLDLEF